MAGIVLELQADCLDPKASVAVLVKKAFLIAKKLKIPAIESWLKSELDGYESDTDVPDYRRIRGEPTAFNSVNGVWMPVRSNSDRMDELLSVRTCTQSIAEIEDLAQSDGTGFLTMSYSAKLTNDIMRSSRLPFQPVTRIPRTAMRGVLDTVRNRVLDWTLALEAEGVTGTGLSFSDHERTVAQQITYNIGSMNQSQIQHGTTHSTQQMENHPLDVDALRALCSELQGAMADIRLDASARRQMTSDLATVEAQLQAHVPKRNILRECVSSLRDLATGAAATGRIIEVIEQIRHLVG